MQPILKSERFQNDLSRYNQALEKVPEGKSKEDVKKLVHELILEVNKMDSLYLDMIYTRTLSSSGDEIRKNILSLRKKIEDKLADTLPK